MKSGSIVDRLCRSVGAAAFADLADGELLAHFLAGRNPEAEAAFVVLVQRHGPMVYRTCRSALRDGHDADDAFQATFLVLARKAKSVQSRTSLGPWLYEVARRVSAHARVVAARRIRHEQQAARHDEETPPSTQDTAALVHDALGRLPERMRTPIVLCDLEGLSYQETAERLGWSLGAVRNQLSRARQRLRSVLQRMGLDPAAASVAWHALPPMPRELATTTAAAASKLAAGLAVGTVPISVLTLTNQGLQSMLVLKMKSLGLTTMTTAVLIAGAYGLSGQTPGDKAAATKPAKGDAPADVAQAPQPSTGALIAKLTQPRLEIKPIEQAPLRDVLEFLSENYKLSFVVDTVSFDRDLGTKQIEDTMVRLPKMTNVDLNTVLRYITNQINGAVLVRADHLEIVSENRAFQEAHGRVPGELHEQRRIQPLVNVSQKNALLATVLADIARQAGRNIVLDARVPERDKLTVTANLLNVPVDTAVRVLAELADLKCVQMDSVFFVTTLERSINLQENEEHVAKQRLKAGGDMPHEPAAKAAKP